MRESEPFLMFMDPDANFFQSERIRICIVKKQIAPPENDMVSL